MNETNVLVVGSGGREHALVWKLQQSKRVHKVFCAPGNGGIPNSVPINASDFEGLAAFARRNRCFTVVGPEEPLTKGIVDHFLKEGLVAFGVAKDAAIAESSKIWARRFMKDNDIPHPAFEAFEDPAAAADYVKKKPSPIVVKADGLASGKGVAVCHTEKEALETISDMMVKKRFGSSGERVIIEDMLVGEEASYMVIIDTKAGRCIPLASSQDHKPILDGDEGPNTGGMGAYSPAPIIDSKMQARIKSDIIDRFIDGIRSANLEFKGTLYLGLMVSDGVPYVLEFNVRFGDPETQPVLLRMKSDLFEYLEACVNGRLDDQADIEWSSQAAVCVVMASSGYPGQYEKGNVIAGLGEAAQVRNAVVFHAGTAVRGTDIVTNGGRVLGVTALGDTIPRAIQEAYRTVGLIHWEGEYHRKDIGRKALRHSLAA
jgi:phosphoribosylamine--glycine ligase